MGWAHKLAACVPLIALGIWTFIHVNDAVGPFLNPILAECPAKVETQPKPGIPVVDSVVGFCQFFLCFIVPFFDVVLKVPEGVLLFGYFVAGLGQPLTAFLAVESSRAGARAPLTWLWIYMALFQLIGISIIYPILWLPAYFFVGLHCENHSKVTKAATKAALGKWNVSPYRVAGIWIITTVNVLLFVAMCFPWSPAIQELLISVFQFAPILSPLLWVLIGYGKPDPAKQKSGHDAACALHLMAAGIGTMAHMMAIGYSLFQPSALFNLLDLFRDHSGTKACTYFLLIDFLVLLAAMLYHVAWEEGLVALLLVSTLTVVFGPGTAFGLYYAYRERQVAKLVDAEAKSKRK